jgi:predicted protein tyrosine phosphatase
MRIIVGPLDAVPRLIAGHRPARVVSLLAPGQAGPVVADRPHLRLDVHDISATAPGLVAPGGELIDRLLAFASAACGPVLVHCWFAISRSPAAAYILACAHAPPGHEEALAQRLRAASPECTPNPRMVALADARLGRAGRMVEAIARIGRGVETDCGRSFTLEA